MPPTTSLWLETSPPIPTDAFEWDGHYDTIVVGAGLTGVATALIVLLTFVLPKIRGERTDKLLEVPEDLTPLENQPR